MAENLEELIQKVGATGIPDRKALGKSLLAGIHGQELNNVVAAILADLPKVNLKTAFVDAAKQLPDEEKKAAVTETAAQLSKPLQDQVAQEIRGGLPPPLGQPAIGSGSPWCSHFPLCSWAHSSRLRSECSAPQRRGRRRSQSWS